MKKTVLILTLPLLLVGAVAGYSFYRSYNSPLDTAGAQYIDAQTFRQWLAQDRALVVDVQTYSQYTRMHFPDSIPTHAYPVRTAEQIKRVESIVPLLKQSKKPIVLVCIGGVTGAPNARLVLLARGIPNRQLFILEGGTWGWPWKSQLVTGNRR